jgi:tRNA-specific 2-thiouridylase
LIKQYEGKYFIKNNMKKNILVAMSGGVDSSVSSALLKKKGYNVLGAHIKTWILDEKCATKDLEDARNVADILNIPFYVFDFEKEYKEKIIKYFVETYQKGETPNPDVLCNKEIKFGIFLEKAKKLKMDFISTGHYANIKKDRKNKEFKLLKGKDKNKDQSYFLWQLSQEQLSKSIFPIGNLKKEKVRKLARKFNLPTAEKKDSQGICFLGEIELKDFLKKFLKIKKGDIILPNKKVVGEHDGAVFYTIGQRRGFNLSSSSAGIKTGEPLFIIDKDIKKNILIVAPGKNNKYLLKKNIWLKNTNFISKKIPEKKLKLKATIRYRQKPQKAILFFDDKIKLYKLEFEDYVWAPAIGQHAVFYKKNELIGGGIIEKVE